MAVEIKVPTLGESIAEATVAKWIKNIGDSVTEDEPVVELETDKATLEVPAPASGIITSISAEVGDNVEVGGLLAMLDKEGAATPAKAAPVTTSKKPTQNNTAETETQAKEGPAAKRLIAENNLDTSQMSGSAKDGRLTKGDVLAAINQPAAKSPKPANRKNEPREERVPMTKLRKVIARRLKEAQNNAAMLTTFNEVDMSGVMAMRAEYRDLFEKKHGVKVGFMSFFVHATIAALKEFPAVNAEIHGEDIIYKNFYNIGVAVGTPQGLVVPVLKDADTMSFAETEVAIGDYAVKAKSGKLTMDDMAGGTFSISNGGVYGSMLSMPILNPPQSGILGMHNIQKRAVVVSTDKGDEIQIKPMMYLALSYDHRIIDGREAVSFLSRIKNIIEDPRRLILGL